MLALNHLFNSSVSTYLIPLCSLFLILLCSLYLILLGPRDGRGEQGCHQVSDADGRRRGACLGIEHLSLDTQTAINPPSMRRTATHRRLSLDYSLLISTAPATSPMVSALACSIFLAPFLLPARYIVG